ncbi:MAG: heavy metal translocating P-type ATPase metal-binding domain-containing protein [Verrucomicrobia bacterium]|nr:heavy metal translocating P-type ATPase metal-binding domain-containing protein [Verrucomicrobiota bacterium]
MAQTITSARIEIEGASQDFATAPLQRTARPPCFHCGTACRGDTFRAGEKSFCCQGCRTVFGLLTENGLGQFYQLGEAAGVRVNGPAKAEQFRFLDEPAVRERLADFSDAKLTRVTLRLPAIHCIACVWLLENLFRLKPGIGQSQVNFPRKEVSIAFETAKVKLSEVAALLASLGYEPELKFSDLENRPPSRVPRRLWMQLGLAGFAFGNAMLFSIATYLGLDAFSGPAFQKLVGFVSLALAVPVVIYSAADYYRSAWVSVRQRLLNIDVPIAAGIIAIFAQSAFEVVSGRGEGYFDSLCGLIFFLLCGKLFQQKTYERLAFDRDYKSFFPLSVTRKQGRAEESVSLAQLAVGDHLLLRNGELIPADAKLISGPAVIDYSFVTGESEPVEKKADDYLYAGGRQIGGAIEVEMVKGVSQSYLTSLWNQDAFRKDKTATLNALTNTYSQRFTKIVIAIALGSAVFWAFVNSDKSLKSFTSVLIVACPCALALAAPFALGTAQRVLARRNVFLKNPYVLESLAKVDAVVFDKTGTLTAAGASSVTWRGAPLSEAEECWLYSMTRHSTHPLPVRIGEAIARHHFPEPVRSFLETAGCGMEGTVAGNEIWMGSAAWLESCNVRPALADSPAQASAVHVAINGRYRGSYILESALRPEADRLITKLSEDYDLALLSGDHEKERARFTGLFGESAHLHFNQSPLNKLGFIHDLQRGGKTVMMVGDGLNDAGALKQSDVGVAVVENVNAFSPASDVILAAGMVPRIGEVLRYAKQSVRMVRAAFVISSLYNVVGIAIAASGNLSPIVCAILMPVSSVTVVAFACGATTWLGRGLAAPKKTERLP